MNADLTDPQYSCPSDVTFTTDGKDDQGQFTYCIVQPEDNSCKLHSDCRPTAFPDVLCDSMRIARVDNIPANITSLNLGFNALREFNPTYTNGTSNLRVLSLAANYFEDMDDLTIPSSVQIMTLSHNYLNTLKFSQGFSSVIKLRVTQSDPGCESNTPGIADLEAKNIGLASLGDLQLPSTIMNLDVSANPNMTFDKFVAPADLRSFMAVQSEIKALSEIDFSPTQQLSAIILNGNNISSITGVNFPSGLQTLDLNGSDVSCFRISRLRAALGPCENHFFERGVRIILTFLMHPSDLSGNTISSIVGVEFPPKLRSLNLNGSDISCFLVRESDVSTLTGLSTFIVSSISQDGCDSAVMNGTRPQPLTIADKSYDFSVIGDAEFTSRYFPHKVETTPPPLPTPTPAKSSSTTIIIVVVVVVVVLLAGIGFFFYRRRRSRFHKSMTYWNLSTPTPQTGTTTGTTASSGSIGMPVNDIRHDPELVKRRVPQSSIKRSRVLAKGGFGIVYLATFNDREVVAKQILPEKAKDSHAISRFMDEIRLWAKLNHPNIVQFLGLSWTTLADVTVVTEYMSNGDLAVMLRSQAAVSRHRELFTWTKSAGQIKRNKLELAIDIAEALVYLHGQSPSIIHRDLKSQNVLLNESCVAKVTDFGISREVEDYMTAEIGTVAWIAPEILDGGQYTERADIYSFGVVLSELDTCEKPYASGIHTPTGEFIAKVPNAHIALAVSDGSLRPSFDNDCPRAIRAIAQRCLEGNAEDRPTPFELLTELCALQGQL